MLFSSRSMSHLRGFLIFLTCLLLSSATAEAQAYLYGYSFVVSGTSPLGAVLADFNGDGRKDLATVNYENSVSVMLGQPDAAFASPVDYATGASPFALIKAKLRGTKDVDLVTLNMPNGIDQPGTISVLLGNGDGTFQTHVDYSVGDFPVGVVAGDFNNDGKIDLAIANNNDNTISVLYGNGDGSFQSQVVVSVGSGPTAMSIGDFNRDGKTDLIASCVGSGVVSVLLNAGSGAFTRVDSSSGLFGPDKSLVVTGKFTDDGKLDVAISSKIQEQIYLLKGNGDGSFMSPVPLEKTALGQVYSLIAADINADGKADLAYGTVGPDEFSVRFGDGKGTFSAPILSPVFATESVLLSDINGDGFLDLVTPEQNLNSVAVVLGNGKGQFGWPKTVRISGTAFGPNATVVADFNGDGKLDLAVAETNFPSGQVAVVLGEGLGSFGPALTSPLLSEAINNQDLMLSGDFNGDGRPDLIMMDDFSTGFQVLLGKGDGTFQTPVDTKLNASLNFAIGDFNTDGKTDVVVSTFSNGQELISIYLGKGDGTFKLGAQYTEPYGGPIVADVNRDGKPDLAFAGNPTFVMLGNGDGTFQRAITGPIVLGQSKAIVDDFNGDGAPDIVVATSNGVAFLKGNGDGTFQAPIVSVSTTVLCCELLAEDVNGDGKLDLVNNSGGGVSALLGNGDGTFRLPFGYGVIGQAFTGNIAVGDFNADGVGDIGVVYENPTSGKTDVSLYLSEPTLVLFPRTLYFGTLPVGQTSPPINVKVANVGNRRLSISGIQASPAFAEHNNCGQKLGIGQSCTIQIVFEPKTIGTQTGAVNLKDGALGAIQQIRLSGTGK